MPDPLPPAGPPPATSLEADLRALREAKGISLDAIQQESRIPADILQRFEAGQLTADGSFNEVYLRAFLRTYAHAVGLQAADIVAAYEAQRDGVYRGLHAAYEPARTSRAEPATAPEPAPRPPEPLAAFPAEPPAPAPLPPAAPPAGPSPGRPASGSPPRAPKAASSPVATPAAALAATPPPPQPTVAPTGPGDPFPKRRVERREAARTPRAFDRAWGLIVGGALVTAVVIAAVLFWLFRGSGDPEGIAAAVAPADTTAMAAGDSAQAPAEPAGPVAPRLQLPLRVTVTATGNGLQSFRVTDEDGRRPFWADSGGTFVFESSDEIILWGEGASNTFDDAVVELQGVRWTPQSGPVRISAQTGQRLLDSLVQAAVPVPGPAAPAGSPPAAPAPAR